MPLINFIHFRKSRGDHGCAREITVVSGRARLGPGEHGCAWESTVAPGRSRLRCVARINIPWPWPWPCARESRIVLGRLDWGKPIITVFFQRWRWIARMISLLWDKCSGRDMCKWLSDVSLITLVKTFIRIYHPTNNPDIFLLWYSMFLSVKTKFGGSISIQSRCTHSA
jgi:hypothetical protein